MTAHTTLDEIFSAIDAVDFPDIPRSAGEKGAQARQGGKPGLSQHVREAPEPPVDEEPER
ncbi:MULTISPECIES: hypothetical protein [Streptomyces]|uniref:Uncharacterized protein n=1 Tax=Streptomyces odorifer TaxID=53450 RepID=A0A7Y6EZC4_9ACTN|nr:MULTISPECIES: hypothetical protein [Streptomyces]NUV37054.1 hypothetical protein [Streptomyces sp. KAI-27]NUV50231.1 hypothetical protein [Streptomyces sp. CAI-78]MCG5118252.1 hypothetical protein [Streptomyces sp. T7(2022)]MCQ9709814.1 hypothetical protein [Streptomyces sp. BSP1]MCR0990684.1 hypothetical protein [Streptomyces albidoflavus]